MRRVGLFAAPCAAATAAVLTTRSTGCAVPDTGKNVDLYAAERLRSFAMRARDTLSDPPTIMRRCARSAWRSHATADAVDELDKSQISLRDLLVEAANTWKEKGTVDVVTLTQLDGAASKAESAVRAVRASAARGAAAVPWNECIGASTVLEQADRGTKATVGVDSLNSKIVALYFTASWCGPCHRFSPTLVSLYESLRGGRARGAEKDLEVVLVSWDEEQADRERYARSAGMRWLALPHEERALVDELTLRYDVKAIPTVIVLEVSSDGKEATVLSMDGRTEVLQGNAEWLRRVTPSASGGGGESKGGGGWFRGRL